MVLCLVGFCWGFLGLGFCSFVCFVVVGVFVGLVSGFCCVCGGGSGGFFFLFHLDKTRVAPRERPHLFIKINIFFNL